MVALDLDLDFKVIFLPESFGAPGLITCPMFLNPQYVHTCTAGACHAGVMHSI